MHFIKNKILLQHKIVKHIKRQNSLEEINNNFNIYCNYEAINDLKTDNFIREINEFINLKYNKNSDISSMSKFFISILENFNSQEINIEAKCKVVPIKEGNEDIKKKDKKNNEIKKHVQKKI